MLEVLLLYPHERPNICLSTTLDSFKPSRQFQDRTDVVDYLISGGNGYQAEDCLPQ